MLHIEPSPLRFTGTICARVRKPVTLSPLVSSYQTDASRCTFRCDWISQKNDSFIPTDLFAESTVGQQKFLL